MNAIERLRAVLCAPDGTVSIHGSDGDRAIIHDALAELEALTPAPQVPEGMVLVPRVLLESIRDSSTDENARGFAAGALSTPHPDALPDGTLSKSTVKRLAHLNQPFGNAEQLASPGVDSIDKCLEHPETLGYVDVAGFKRWVSLNPGAVSQLIIALFNALPLDTIRPAVLASLTGAPAGNPEQLASVEQRARDATDSIVRDICEVDPADPDSPETVSVRVDDLRLILERTITAALSAQPCGVDSLLTETERGVIETLLQLAYAAWCLADNTEDDGGEGLNIERSDFAVMNKHLDALEALPDDQPGYTMGEAAKARWALRRLLEVPSAAPQPREVRGVEYDRVLIAEMLDDLLRAEAAAADRGTTEGRSYFNRDAIAAQAQLLRDADNREGQARTVRLGPATTPQDAAGVEAYPTGNDREVLIYLMQQFDAETWQCPGCGHAEDTATMDSADYLRKYLAEHPAAPPPAIDIGKLRELVSEWRNDAKRKVIRVMAKQQLADADQLAALIGDGGEKANG